MTTSGRKGFLRSLNKENDESPAVPSEASVRTEPICEHRRNRCPKSALGLAVQRHRPGRDAGVAVGRHSSLRSE